MLNLWQEITAVRQYFNRILGDFQDMYIYLLIFSICVCIDTSVCTYTHVHTHAYPQFNLLKIFLKSIVYIISNIDTLF